MKAIRVHQTGGPEVLQLDEVTLPPPGAGEALVRIEAIGVNFIDINHRSGAYPLPLPFTPGQEAAGVVTAVGPDVTDVKPGDRVAWAAHPGAYAEAALVPAWKLVPIPAGLDAKSAAAVMLQGMTAHYLLHASFPLRAGHSLLLHAAAGGVGLLAIQMAKRLGGLVIGTVSTDAKAEIARAVGADEVVVTTRQDFAAEARRLTGGAGVHVVYDSVGRDTFERSLSALRPRGYLVLFGQASGPVPPFELGRLGAGSLTVTRPALGHFIATRAELLERAGDVLGAVSAGALRVQVGEIFPLRDAARAHAALAGRGTSGKLLLVP